MKAPKYFHELTDEEFSDLSATAIFWDFVPLFHPQPVWCQYPGALNGIMGCWALTSRLITGEDCCKKCDCYHLNQKDPR